MTEQLPPDVIAQLTAMGPMITPELVQGSWALLTPFHQKAGYTAPAIDRDRRYGDHERHRLDVHTSGAGPAGGSSSKAFRSSSIRWQKPQAGFQKMANVDSA